EALLASLRDRASDRKLRLFMAACCRAAWHLLPDERSRQAVAAAEVYADGRLARPELQAARRAAQVAARRAVRAVAGAEVVAGAALVCVGASYAVRPGVRACAALALAEGARATGKEAGRRTLGGLLGDLFGTPGVTPAAVDPAWRTPDVSGLARAAYEGRRLP